VIALQNKIREMENRIGEQIMKNVEVICATCIGFFFLHIFGPYIFLKDVGTIY
jgi:hypothetical protein